MRADTIVDNSTAQMYAVEKSSAAIRRRPKPLTSMGGLDEINPDDVVYGEYASGLEELGNWIDLVYLDDDILRTFSGSLSSEHPFIQELKILLKAEDLFYVVPIKQLARGLAFKRKDITDIKVTSAQRGNDKRMPSCIWSMHFQDGQTRTLEADYQAYFSYGNTNRPRSMTNATILDRIFTNKRG